MVKSNLALIDIPKWSKASATNMMEVCMCNIYLPILSPVFAGPINVLTYTEHNTRTGVVQQNDEPGIPHKLLRLAVNLWLGVSGFTKLDWKAAMEGQFYIATVASSYTCVLRVLQAEVRFDFC